jgi:DNA-binding response OmpR family regulator
MQPETGKTILIVDDDPDLAHALALRLGHQGYRCVTAGTGAQGLAEFNRGRIDLVITDLNMPSGDGVALSESVRRQSSVPLIVITGFKDEFKRRLRSVDNVTVLRKPFEAGDLVELVDATLTFDSDDSNRRRAG